MEIIERFSLLSVSVLISVVAMGLSILVDDRKCNIVYKLTVLSIFFLSSIKYYWPMDVLSYSSYYDNIPTIWQVISNGWGNFNVWFEMGFTILCSIAKGLGFSFWFFTVVINFLLFHSLYRLVNNAVKYKTIIFCTIFVLCNELAFNQIRQAVCCALYFYAIDALLQNKSLIKVFLLSAISCTMHYSCIFAALPILFFCTKNQRLVVRKSFISCLLILLLLIPLDFRSLIINLTDILGIGLKIQKSLADVFYGKQLSKFMIPLIPLLIVPAIIKDDRTDAKSLILRKISLIGNIYFAVFFTYDRFMERFMYFFLPIGYLYMYDLLVYSSTQRELHKVRLLRQATVAVSLMMFAYNSLMLNAKFNKSVALEEFYNPNALQVFTKSKSEQIRLKEQQLDKSNAQWRLYRYDIAKRYGEIDEEDE